MSQLLRLHGSRSTGEDVVAGGLCVCVDGARCHIETDDWDEVAPTTCRLDRLPYCVGRQFRHAVLLPSFTCHARAWETVDVRRVHPSATADAWLHDPSTH